MPKASEIKRGMILDIDGMPHIVKQLESKSPSTRGGVTMYKMRLYNLASHEKLDVAYKGDEMLRTSECERVPVQFSYQDGDLFYFMNMEDYSQYGLGREHLEEHLDYLTEQLDGITALLLDGQLLGIEMPPAVNLTIVDTPPAMAGSSATSRTKTARLNTGLEVQVPDYLSNGDVIRVNTATGKYMSRA